MSEYENALKKKYPEDCLFTYIYCALPQSNKFLKLLNKTYAFNLICIQ